MANRIVGDGCSKEIANFCSEVPLGEGRVLNCLHTHNTQLSSGCQASISKGMTTIEGALGNANFFGAQCAPSIDRFCSGVTPGAGLLLDCLMDHVNNIERRCYMAMRDLQLFED